MNKPFLSIILPAYNESERIGVALESIAEYLKDKDYESEVVVVSDGSRDATVAVAEKFQNRIQNLRVIENLKNTGKGYAVKCGMLAARGKYRLFMDADNSVDISHLGTFLPYLMDKGYDLAIGSIEVADSHTTEHNGLYRRILSRISKLPVRILATPTIRDTQRGFKLFTAKAAWIIFPKQTIERFAFDIEDLVIARENGLTTAELPVTFDNPEGSKVRLGAYLDSLGELSHILYNKLSGAYAA